MITLAYSFIMVLMVSGVFAIDYFLLHKSLEEMVFFIIVLYGGTNRWWIISALVIGFFLSILTDMKEYKKKKSKGLNHGQ